jgi:hypothetical protein
MGRTRGARLALLVLLAGCGARTELFGPPPDEVATDGGVAPQDASGAFEASSPFDAGVVMLDATTFDGGFTPDSAAPIDAGTLDAATLDAGIDAATIECVATEPTQLADATAGLDQIAIDSHHVYFHDESGVHRVGKSGGAVITIAPLKNWVWPDLGAFDVNDDGLTLWQYQPGTSPTIDVSRIGPNGGAPVKIATLQGMPGAGTLNDLDHALIVYGGPAPAVPGIMDVAPDGTATYVPSGGFDLAFARSDDTDVYYSSNWAIYRSGAKSDTQIGKAPDFTYITSFVFDGDTIYFVADDSTQDVTVGSMPKKGGGPTTILWSSSSVALGGMAQDETFLYVVDRFKPAIVRIRKDGTGVDDAIAGVNGKDSYMDVKVDDKCVYFTAGASTPTGKPGVYATPK